MPPSADETPSASSSSGVKARSIKAISATSPEDVPAMAKAPLLETPLPPKSRANSSDDGRRTSIRVCRRPMSFESAGSVRCPKLDVTKGLWFSLRLTEDVAGTTPPSGRRGGTRFEAEWSIRESSRSDKPEELSTPSSSLSISSSSFSSKSSSLSRSSSPSSASPGPNIFLRAFWRFFFKRLLSLFRSAGVRFVFCSSSSSSLMDSAN
mmetsp:Transcript_20676/g.43224  ORF Transcript_20676/g.43224 Transcript_20676/m.43224 type:complete len:208 (+) Transcript_20676:3326-3949(+)